jgi:hypothetical protein
MVEAGIVLLDDLIHDIRSPATRPSIQETVRRLVATQRVFAEDATRRALARRLVEQPPAPKKKSTVNVPNGIRDGHAHLLNSGPALRELEKIQAASKTRGKRKSASGTADSAKASKRTRKAVVLPSIAPRRAPPAPPAAMPIIRPTIVIDDEHEEPLEIIDSTSRGAIWRLGRDAVPAAATG